MLLGAFLLAAGAAVIALFLGSEAGATVGVIIAGGVGVLMLWQLLASERRRHEVAEEELAGQASFLESLVTSFRAIASTLEVEQILNLTRAEAERLFDARASLLEPGETGGHGPDEHELLLPLSRAASSSLACASSGTSRSTETTSPAARSSPTSPPAPSRTRSCSPRCASARPTGRASPTG